MLAADALAAEAWQKSGNADSLPEELHITRQGPAPHAATPGPELTQLAVLRLQRVKLRLDAPQTCSSARESPSKQFNYA